MSTTRRLRRGAVVAAAALVATLLPALGPASPASAAETCESEAPPTLPGPLPLPIGTGCDDITQPDTAVDRVIPAPNAERWINVDHVSFTFGGTPSTGDTGALRYECQFYNGAVAPSSWSACASPKSYTGLADSGAYPYTFRVRAVDADDAAIDLTAGLFGQDADVPDFDQTPAQTTVSVDTVTPDTYIFSAPRETQRPDLPMATTRHPQVRLIASESETGFRCTVNRKSVPCTEGVTTLRGLKPGDQKLEVRAVDRAGNVDTSPAREQFALPRNLVKGKGKKKAKGWRRYPGQGYFANDYLEARKYGAEISVFSKNFREVRLIAPRGPKFGKLQIKLARGAWRNVNLRAKRYTRFHVYLIRDEFSPMLTGKIRLRVASRNGRPVPVDALLAH